MFTLRQLFFKKVALLDGEAVNSQNLRALVDLEKSEHAARFTSLPRSHVQTRRGRRSFVHNLVVFAVCFCFALLSAPSISKYAISSYDAILRGARTAYDHVHCNQGPDQVHPISLMAPPWDRDPVGARPLDRNTWSVMCSSSSTYTQWGCPNVIDLDEWTEWHSDAEASHWVVINLGRQEKVHSLAVFSSPRGDQEGGMVRRHTVQVATEMGKWTTVAAGTWRDDDTGARFAIFEPQVAQFVNLTILDTTKKTTWVAIRQVSVYGVPTIYPAPSGGGKWGMTIDFPLVPVTAFVNPISGILTTFSSYRRMEFKVGNRQTYSATWNPATGIVEQKLLTKTEHDMFCPGTSFDEKGFITITGGDTPKSFSIYNSLDDTYSTPTDNETEEFKTLAIGRGYQGQTFMANGKTFMIGGAWSGDPGPRTGEIYDPKTQNWEVLSNLKDDYIRMDRVISNCDNFPNWSFKCTSTELEWSLHHAWLFSWKNDSVFHAGPSKRMNWFFPEVKDGLQVDAGFRADDFDAVCGVTSMYDAEKGLLLTAGGSRNYHYWVDADRENGRAPWAPHRNESTNNVFEITLAKPGEKVQTRRLASMNFQRIFANGVILPTGQILVVGGQQQGEPFVDDTWQPVPEIYTPETNTWKTVARHSTPRGYHSWALLMPDASVVVGGAGLANPATDHWDAQIYYPPYLFQSDGTTLATRPKITIVDNANDKKQPYKVDGTITFTTDVAIDGVASLIRYSAETHAVNNDLRRVKLTPASVGNPSDRKYTVHIPKDPGVVLPGYWMLFVLKDGVPSVAATVQILAS